MNHVRGRWLDIAVVAIITAFVALVSQRWTGFTSPDSEFYASYALFGSAVADRAIEPAYTWTRLGYIAPVRGLTAVFGTWVGFEIWRVILLAMIVGSTYAIAHMAGRSRWLGSLLALAVGLNTVVLAFAGNTYLTGTIIAVTFVLIAIAVSQLGSAARRGLGIAGLPRWTTAFVSGLLAGWLIMLNPYAFLLGTGLWISVRTVVLIRLSEKRWRLLGIDAVAAAVGAVISFTGFWLAGLAIFPGRSWWDTYLEWNDRLDYTVFIGDATTWQRDTALLVVVLALVASIIAVIAQPRHRWAWAALALSTANIAITAVLMVVLTGPWLESPTYVAKLWPGALLSLVLVFVSMSPGTHEGKKLFDRWTAVAIAVSVPALMWSGRFDGVLPLSTAWILFAGLAALIGVLGWRVRGSWNAGVALLLLGSLGATFVAAQFLQNGRGLLGIYGQYPFRSAFVDFSFEDQMATKVAVQRWLLDNTQETDQIAIWTDPARLTADAAGMQLWGGFNLVTPDATLNRETTGRLEELRPSVVAMYAPDRAQIDDFYASLPPWSLPSEPECTTGPYLGVGTGEVVLCLTRLTWVG